MQASDMNINTSANESQLYGVSEKSENFSTTNFKRIISNGSEIV